jgi:peptide/nickel transport system substrate-binding protein
LSPDVRSKLDTYAPDAGQAASLLEEAGLTKDGDTWNYNGKPLSFEITAPTDFPDLLASAKDVSEQLNDFGFDTDVRGIPAASRPDTIAQGRYQALLDFSLVSAPEHPATSLDWNMAAGFFGTNNPESSGAKGLDWPWHQTAPDGSQVYIPDLLAQATAGLDKAPQQAAVETLAQIFNDQLPVIPIFERYTTDPIAHGPRVTGWLPASDPIYQNNQGNDPYVAMQFLAGVLKPADGSDGTFKTDAPYAQPPDFSWNYYAANGMWNTLTTPAYHVTLPPLFFHARAIDSYVACVGKSYSIAKVG